MSRDFVMVHTADQWLRTAFQQTSIEVERGAVQLAWERETAAGITGEAPAPAGLAFDPWCRLYRSIPEEGRVVRMRWGDSGPATDTETDLFETGEQGRGDFALTSTATDQLNKPQCLAVDGQGRLFIAEVDGRVLIYDLVEKRLLRAVHLGGTVLDLACDESRVVVLLDDP